MGLWTIVLLAVGLAMDATAVAAARGLAAKQILLRHVLLISIAFGGFQALMPAVGWAVGARIGPALAAWDHWIAFVLLCGIGGKMLWEARYGEDEEHTHDDELFRVSVVLLLAVATSVDALAAGISLPMLGAPFVSTIAIIGVTTALLSALGLFVGRRFGEKIGARLDALGGLVLIGIGCKILIEHLLA